jgi:K+-sensing histidine kinase KdpD
VSAVYEEEEGSIVAEVSDQGSGIPIEQSDLIFEKYGTLKNAPEGVHQFGLGLYFCKLAVEAHGGTIEVEPNEPFGSIFRIVMPLVAIESQSGD